MGSGGDFFHIRQCGIFAMTRHVDTSGNVRNHKNTWGNAITNEPATMGFQAKFTQVTKTAEDQQPNCWPMAGLSGFQKPPWPPRQQRGDDIVKP